MNDRKLIEEIQKAARNERAAGLILPSGQRTYRSWPLCQTCGREVDRTQLENTTATSVTLRAWCHGKEDTVKINFPYRIEGDPLGDGGANDSIQHAINAWVAFDPYKILK